MSWGSSSSTMIIAVLLVLLIIVLPAGAAKTTTEPAVTPNQTAVPTTETTVTPNQTAVPTTETTVTPNQTAVPTTEATVTPNQTAVNTTPTVTGTLTSAKPRRTTPPVTQPSTAVSTAATVTPGTTSTATGNVSVFSSPSGASILIDGIYIGTTPGSVQGVPAGTHILRLTMSGYNDYEGSIYVVAGQTVQAYGTLQPFLQAVSGAPTTPVTVQVIVPIVTAQPTKDSGSPPDTGVMVAVIGAISVIIVSAAKVFTHIRPPRKE